MKRQHQVAGVFLERTGAYFLKVRAKPSEENGWEFFDWEHEPIPWSADAPDLVHAGLQTIGRIIEACKDEISGIAISSYGPFLSLTPGPNFGVISPEYAAPPLNALDLYGFVKQRLGDSWLKREDSRIVIETDASACSVGEAYLRGFGRGQVLAYIFATQGIGLGITKGKRVIRNALHPEVGLLPAYIHPEDPLGRHVGKVYSRLNRDSTFDFRSIAQLSNTSALWARYNQMRSKGDFALQFSDEQQGKTFWDIRAFYLAQACIACTVVLPPHKIVIGADVDRLGDVASKVEHHFEIFLRGWRMKGEPLFTYEELSDNFIVGPSLVNGKSVKAQVTGALGLCYMAASASEEEKMVGIPVSEGKVDG